MFFRLKYSSFFLVFSFLISGCGVWDNFTTYFNLYYNTTDIFEEAEQQIKEQERGLFSTEELVIPGTVNTQLVKVIEKCSEILQFHPGSAYVDEALLMLGKSFYYQKNYQKALRKFEEFLASQAESDLITETNLWIAKTEMKLKNYEHALSILAEVRSKASEEGREDLLNESFIEEIIYRISQEDFREAINLANQLVESSGDDDIKAEVLYELGKLYNLVEEPQNAVAVFEKVLDYESPYEIELNTKLELGKTLRKIDEKEKALDIFNDMREENKFSDAYNQVDLETGITLHELGRLEEAVEKLTFVDTSYKSTPSSGIAKYKLGEIYEYDYKNFDSASSYYQKSLTSSLSKEYTADATQKIRTFKKYQTLTSQIQDNQKQLFYVDNPDEYTKDSLVFVRDSITYVEDSINVLEELNLFTEHLESLSILDTLTKDTSSVDTTAALDSLKDSTIVVDSLLDNPRLNATEILRQRNKSLIKKNVKDGIDIDSLFAEKWGDERKFPVKPLKSNLGPDSLRSLLVKNELELGNLFLTELELFDSAYYYYNDVVTRYPKTTYYASALYALGSYYLNTEQKEKADSLFNYVYENFRGESIVNAAANQLNKPLIDLDFDPAKDIYADAESDLLNNNYEISLDKFYSIYKIYPKSLIAPRALFTSGWILENQLKLNDSAAVIYDTLVAHYPQSEFTGKVRPKLNAYKQYKEEIKKAVEDSLKRIEQEKINLLANDSLGVVSDSLQTEQTIPEREEILNPEAEDKNLNTVEAPDIKTPSDSSRSVILNNPRRNPRRK